MKKKIFKVKNVEELDLLVGEFRQNLNPKDIVLLQGDVGVGKTTFVKCLSKHLGIKKSVSSPTFNIIKAYDNILCHVDAYRVNDEDIGLDYYLEEDYIICIEWACNIKNYIEDYNYIIDIKYYDSGRLIEIIEMEK